MKEFMEYLFMEDEKLKPQINRVRISFTYLEFIEIMHVILLYTLFVRTNNPVYSIWNLILSTFQMLSLLLTRISQKYYVYKINGLLTFGTMITLLYTSGILFTNFKFFQTLCNEIQNFYTRNPAQIWKSKETCKKVTFYYYLQLSQAFLIILVRLFTMYINYKAYSVAENQYNLQQTKKRRKDKFNEQLKRKHIHNENRKL